LAKMNREQQKAMFAKQKVELLRPHFSNFRSGDFGLFDNLPVEKAKKLMTGYPNVDPKDTQNNSPTMAEMLKLAKTHDGTVGGYIIPSDSGRDDSRIQFTSVQLKIDKTDAEKLRDSKMPDEFTQQGKNTFTFWWD